MKIAVNAVGHMGGGGITLLRNLLRQWTAPDERHSFCVFVKESVLPLEELQGPGVKIVPVGFWSQNVLLRLFYEQFILPLYTMRWDADVLFCTADLVPFFSPVPTVLKVGNGIPFVPAEEFESRGDVWRYRFQSLLVRLSVRRADKVVFVSDWLRQRVQGGAGTGDRDSVTVHLGFDPDNFQPSDWGDVDPGLRRALDVEGHRLLSVSTVNPHKNFEVLFRAAAKLIHGADLDVTLFVAGRHPHRDYYHRLQELQERLEIAESVRFLGKVPHRQIAYLYDRADVFVNPSRVESFGHPFLEAMASDLPIVASRTAAIPEIVGEAGLFFEPDDAEELAGRLSTVLRDESTRAAMIEAGRRRLEDFSWEGTARRMMELIEAAAREGTLRDGY